jgi:hypothetical protein
LWHQKSNASVIDQQQTRISPFPFIDCQKLISAPPRSNALTTIYPPTRAPILLRSARKFAAWILVYPPTLGALPNAEFCHARQKNQQVKSRTSALPELRAGHAPGSKDATF